MGCSGCSTSSSGKPGGCQSNGGCTSGGCNRMNVHDWLVNLPSTDPSGDCKIIEVSFNNGSRKDFFRNTTLQNYTKGDMIAVEGVSGFDVGSVSITGELVRLQLKKNGVKEDNAEIKKVMRRATENDLVKLAESKKREPEAIIRSRAIAKQLNLNMKISEVEIQADGRKATFFYIADDRVDFRELIKVYAGEFKVKVEMRQIGARQEAAKVGGIGSCGRELCCSTWLTDFKSVTTTAARYQNLSINQTKLSGQCGRLKCCLNYELDTYLDALQFFPDNADSLEFAKGRAHLIKKDIFKNLMWYTIAGSTKHYPLTIDKVREIKALNQKNIRPEEIEAAEVISNKPREVEPEFVDVVGQISLQSLDRKDRNKRRQQFGNQNQQRPSFNQQSRGGQTNKGTTNQQDGGQQRQQFQPRPNQGQGQQGGNKNQQSNRNQQGGGGQGQQGGNQNNNRNQGGNKPRPPFTPRDRKGDGNQNQGK
jgi:cell fate regulator YaaT (PSP1 superfamily)